MSFSLLGLSEPLLRVLREQGYGVPFPIQIKALPAVLSGRDVMAAAETGTGKTAGFVLPLLQRLAGGSTTPANHIRALILTPTRELAVQVAESVATYGKYLSLTSGVVYGGVKINPQMMKLRRGLDVLVATPGRLLDLSAQNAVKFARVETLVLDEADRLLDLGFLSDIRAILALLPKKRQNLLFSATFSEDIRALTETLLKNPLKIEVGPKNSPARSVKQCLYEVDKKRKAGLLSHLLRDRGWPQVLVFTRTRDGADRLVQRLERDGIVAAALHGDKGQQERSRVLAAFKAGDIRVLVATDVVSRGIDINELPRVVNFDLPQVAEDYIHRIGRTGRAGVAGEAVSLVSADEVKHLAAIESLIGQALVREVEIGFIPAHNVPLTRQTVLRPKKPKKPKKPRQGIAPVPGEGQGIAATPKGDRGKLQAGRTSPSVAAGKAKESTPEDSRSDRPRRGAVTRKKR